LSSDLQLSVEGLTSGYTHAPILRTVSIETEVGQCCGVLGANGAGKTTLLRVIAGTLKAWQGRIIFEGVDITKLSPWKRVRLGIGHVPEGRRVFGPMTVEENLQVAALVTERSSRQAKRAVSDAYDLFPVLGERRRQRAQTMSGGEQQMLAIARALMTRPKLLMIDEMSAGLAPMVAEGLMRDLLAVRDSGVTLLLVEQNPLLIADAVDKVFLLENGTVVATGSLDDLGGAEAIGQRYLGIEV
jgi:branched-chain amino acid transport system ATP-binding protein